MIANSGWLDQDPSISGVQKQQNIVSSKLPSSSARFGKESYISKSPVSQEAKPQEKNTSLDQTADKVSIGVALAAGALALGFGLYKLGKWLFSNESTAVSVSHSNKIPVLENTKTNRSLLELDMKECVTLQNNDFLTLNINFESDEENLWNLYQANKDRLHDELNAAVEEYFGSDIDFVIFIEKGSLWIRILARVKSSVNAIKKQVDLSGLFRKLQTIISSLNANPRIKVVWRVFRETLSVASMLIPVLEFLGISGASEIGESINEWLNKAEHGSSPAIHSEFFDAIFRKKT
jgi:hypothetical protein